jgi:hypothetical protein
MAREPLPLRRNRDFLLLWVGEVISTVGSQISLVATVGIDNILT